MEWMQVLLDRFEMEEDVALHCRKMRDVALQNCNYNILFVSALVQENTVRKRQCACLQRVSHSHLQG